MTTAVLSVDRWLSKSLNISLVQVAMYVSGCVLFSLGVKLFIESDMGTDPLHAMIIGIVSTVNVPLVKIGFVESSITVLSLTIWSLWNKRFPPLMTFVTMAAVGFLIDFWNHVGVGVLAAIPSEILVTLALLIDAYASALIIMSGIGIRIMDLIAISMVEKWGWTFLTAKLLFEVSFVAVAYIFGGPIGAGTLAFVLIVGTLVPPAMWLSTHYLKMPNHGLPSMNASDR
jgi:uncharacterized protein